jgi:hypothetical protein
MGKIPVPVPDAVMQAARARLITHPTQTLGWILFRPEGKPKVYYCFRYYNALSRYHRDQ